MPILQRNRTGSFRAPVVLAAVLIHLASPTTRGLVYHPAPAGFYGPVDDIVQFPFSAKTEGKGGRMSYCESCVVFGLFTLEGSSILFSVDTGCVLYLVSTVLVSNSQATSKTSSCFENTAPCTRMCVHVHVHVDIHVHVSTVEWLYPRYSLPLLVLDAYNIE